MGKHFFKIETTHLCKKYKQPVDKMGLVNTTNHWSRVFSTAITKQEKFPPLVVEHAEFDPISSMYTCKVLPLLHKWNIAKMIYVSH